MPQGQTQIHIPELRQFLQFKDCTLLKIAQNGIYHFHIIGRLLNILHIIILLLVPFLKGYPILSTQI